MENLIIRDETPDDRTAISEVTQAAFLTLPISRNTEHYIIDALRTAGALTISLVAERDGTVVGHIGFSPVTIADGAADWYGLGPISVAPELHRRGIGSALIREGLARIKALGARGCCLVGDPDYYTRFGFRALHGLFHEGVPAEAFLALVFDGPPPQGAVDFHEAFMADEK